MSGKGDTYYAAKLFKAALRKRNRLDLCAHCGEPGASSERYGYCTRCYRYVPAMDLKPVVSQVGESNANTAINL